MVVFGKFSFFVVSVVGIFLIILFPVMALDFLGANLVITVGDGFSNKFLSSSGLIVKFSGRVSFLTNLIVSFSDKGFFLRFSCKISFIPSFCLDKTSEMILFSPET